MIHSNDKEILAAARAGFLDEAVDMLRQYEAALLVMETEPTNAENLHAAFRAAHTIKGTAGLFGFEAVVAFTHGVETLMEALRQGTRTADDDTIALLLQCGNWPNCWMKWTRAKRAPKWPSAAQGLARNWRP
jgi:two-component system, chemotaxis family, sensor kinase CheA